MGEYHETQAPEQWTCPRCGRQLTQRDEPHDCGVYAITTLFSSSDPKIYEIFLQFQDLAAQLGDVTVFPQRAQIDFIASQPFVCIKARGDYIAIGFHFPQPLSGQRFTAIEEIGPEDWLHWVRVSEKGDLDAELVGWLETAYKAAR